MSNGSHTALKMMGHLLGHGGRRESRAGHSVGSRSQSIQALLTIACHGR